MSRSLVGAPAATAAPSARLAVSVVEPPRLPATAKPDGGLRVVLRADAASGQAGTRHALADVVADRAANRLVVLVRATGVARVQSEARATVAPAAGRASRVAIDWVADRDGAGTVETEVRPLDRRGSVLATSRDTLYVLRAGDRVLTSAAGALDLHVRRIRALDGLTALLRGQRLDRLLGADATTTAGTRATSTTTITVGGTIRFTDEAGATHPVRQTQVELRETTVNGSEVVVTTSTGEDGRYSTTLAQPAAAVDLAHAGGRNLFVRAIGEGPGYAIEGPAGPYRIDSSVVKGVRNGAAVTVDLTANAVADNNTAFSAGEAMLEVHDYMTKIGVPIPAIDVDFPTGDVTSNYSVGKLHMLEGDRFDTDVAQHEYGHYVADLLGIDANPGGVHGSTQNLSAARGSKAVGIPLAWGEAWPTYFGTSLQQVLKLAQQHIPHVGDARYADTEDAALDIDLEGSTNDGRSIGEDNAISDLRVLWDVFDSARDTGDTVALGDVPLLNALRAAKVTSFSQAYRALSADVPPKMQIAIGCIAAQQRISPALTAPANGSALTATAPTFTWAPNGGGPRFRSDSFVVQFWDASQQTLLHASPKQTATSFTPLPKVWDAIRAGRQTINVVVRGTQTAPPVTGPYDSCPLALGS